MKWDEMSPRERDALVAEKVMGLPENKSGWYSAMPAPYYCVTEDGADIVERNGERYDHYKFRPSSDISAAWGVVEKMRQNGHDFDIGAWNNMQPVWSARFPKQDVSKSHFGSSSDTAPEAICIAALRAVGVEIE